MDPAAHPHPPSLQKTRPPTVHTAATPHHRQHKPRPPTHTRQSRTMVACRHHRSHAANITSLIARSQATLSHMVALPCKHASRCPPRRPPPTTAQRFSIPLFRPPKGGRAHLAPTLRSQTTQDPEVRLGAASLLAVQFPAIIRTGTRRDSAAISPQAVATIFAATITPALAASTRTRRGTLAPRDSRSEHRSTAPDRQSWPARGTPVHRKTPLLGLVTARIHRTPTHRAALLATQRALSPHTRL